jgi:hypothetical protein
MSDTDKSELSPELFNHLWDSSYAHGDTKREYAEWYEKTKTLIAQQCKEAEERGYNKGYSECMKEWQTS